jgi:hypothetical protein
LDAIAVVCFLGEQRLFFVNRVSRCKAHAHRAQFDHNSFASAFAVENGARRKMTAETVSIIATRVSRK